MPYVPYSPQIGCKYTLTGPNGIVATFNDPLDANYVGVLSDVTGLDSAEVREAAEDLASADGGQHGYFWYGRRPIVLTGTVFGHSTMEQRDARLDRLRRASNAMRADATLAWQNLPLASNASMLTVVRRQQPLRIQGGWVKTFQVSLVSEFAALIGAALNDSGTGAGPFVCENKGDYPSPPVIDVTNGTSATIIENQTTGLVLRFLSTLPASSTISVDVATHTASIAGVSANQHIDYVNSTWPTINMGNNTMRISAGPGTFRVRWRDSWS